MSEWENLTEEEKTSEAGYKEAIRIIENAKENHELSVQLVGLRLLKIPSLIQDLEQITTLNLIHNKISDLHPLGSLQNLTELDLDSNRILDLSPLSVLKNLEKLSLSSTPATDLSPIRSLINLKTLYLNSSPITDLSPIGALSSLTTLRLTSASVTDIYPLKSLSNLKVLYLNSTAVTDLSPLASLTNLEELYLTSTSVVDLSPLKKLKNLVTLRLDTTLVRKLNALSNLVNLNTLRLNDTSISNISPLRSLTKLKVLYLNSTKVEDISPLSSLSSLETLNLNYTHVTDLQPLEKLSTLTWLYLDGSLVTDLSPLRSLPSLTALSLNSTAVDQLSPLSSLTSLTKLHLGSTSVTDLSPLTSVLTLSTLELSATKVTDLRPIGHLKNLKKIYLDSTLVTDLRPLKPLLSNNIDLLFEDVLFKEGIQLLKCSLTNPPLEVAKKGSGSVLQYWETVERLGTLPNREGRILLVGNGAAGKSSLQDKLCDEMAVIAKGVRRPTLGVEVKKDLPFEHNETMYAARVWDFGGQVEQHAIHQYFFGRRSLYVVVIDRRSEEHYDRWLRMINLLGKRQDQETTPVILLFNEKDYHRIPQTTYNIDEYERQFPDLELIPFSVDLGREDEKNSLQTELKGNDPRWPYFRKLLAKYLAELPVMQDILTPYANFPEALEKQRANGKDYLSWAEFEEVCADLELTYSAMCRDAASYLHATGEVIHYGDLEYESLLRRNVIINIKWATKAIYKVLQLPKVVENNGFFRDEDLEEAWSEIDDKDHKLLTQLLLENAFEVCYRLPDGQNFHYLAPGLLPEVDEALNWKSSAGGLFFRLRYEGPAPVGIVTRIIVRLNDILDGNRHYRYGAVFRQPGTGVRALVRHFRSKTGANNEIEIEIDRRGPGAAAFLSHLRMEFNRIHDSFFHGLRPEEHFACSCETCQTTLPGEKEFYSYKDLKIYLEEGDQEVRCMTSRKKVSILEILFGVYPVEDQHIQVLLQQNESLSQKIEDLQFSTDRIEHLVLENTEVVHDIKLILSNVETDIDKLSSDLFSNKNEQVAFTDKVNRIIDLLPPIVLEEKDVRTWQNGTLKKKIKVGINFVKLAGLWGVELDGLDLKFEHELDVSGIKVPRSWAEFKSWFIPA